ncbi:protein of unknown function [Cupriavidus taiwanensis]|uniref:Uncharacterized protein n=1 Tax=Cupriavidus taiwanensis TaxID=164546 RepID=A0A7Z7J8F8_9BURK|nr:protein of unknown function [Cupriavidus taiwanensis]SOZ04696.1 hypothetical protein CBM2597_A50648 [Cupriavidus taiwanensis]SPC09177.1 hypothetical protein CBM2594_A40500 [Cupriavidus taiwanensis]
MKPLSHKAFQLSVRHRCVPVLHRSGVPGVLRCQPETRAVQANSDDSTDALVHIPAHRSLPAGMAH